MVQADERALVRDVNVARARRGLAPLAPDDGLSQFAMQVAQQMAVRHYFGHTDPNGVTFQDRLRAANFRYRFAAENMAFDQDEPHANEAFLTSPGHYANIVDPHPRRIGVAVVAAGDGEVFYVEEFAD
ncbi:MAG TPA: CAP domain-containing protein [Candidatus Elarobacter sp.]|nr:CAP domain-containing protein [Candidatus Elarobacter sp.]